MLEPYSYKDKSNQQLEKIATDLRNNGQIENAVKAYRELIRRYDLLEKLELAANMQHMIGVSYKIANNTELAIRELMNTKERYEAIGNEIGVGRVLRDEGTAYQYAHDYEKALPLLIQSVDILKKYNNKAELGISQVKLGNLYLDQNSIIQAESFMVLGLETLTADDANYNWFYVATAHIHLSRLFIKEEHYLGSLKEINTAYDMFVSKNGESSHVRRLAEVMAIKARIFKCLKRSKEREECIIYCKELLNKIDDDSRKYLLEQPDFIELFEA